MASTGYRVGSDIRMAATSARPRPGRHARCARPMRRCYVHPFRWTSLGLSLIEAMHLGMPVVALATTEVPDAVPPARRRVERRRRPRRRRAALLSTRSGRRAAWVAPRVPRLSTVSALPGSCRIGTDAAGGTVDEDPSRLGACQPAGGAGRRRRRRAERSRRRTRHSAGRLGAKWSCTHDATIRRCRDACAFGDGVVVDHVDAGPAEPIAEGRPAAVHGAVRRRSRAAVATAIARMSSTLISGCRAWRRSTPPSGSASRWRSRTTPSASTSGASRAPPTPARDERIDIERWLSRSVDHIIATTTAERETLIGLGAIRSADLGHPVRRRPVEVSDPTAPSAAAGPERRILVRQPARAAQGHRRRRSRPSCRARTSS